METKIRKKKISKELGNDVSNNNYDVVFYRNKQRNTIR